MSARRWAAVAESVVCGAAAATLAVSAHAEPAVPSVAIVDAHAAVGIAPEAVTAVTRQMDATAARLGYRVVGEATVARVSSRVGPFGPTPPELAQIARDAHVDRALTATVGSSDTHYVVSLMLAGADRTGPFVRTETTDAASLAEVVDRATRSLLPPVPEAAGPSAAPAPAPAREADEARSRIAIQTEGAFGIARHFFYNQLVGARLDYGFTNDFALGGYLGYANLKGKDGRANNVLPYLQLEYRLHWSSTSDVRIPLRFGSGYLPNNGPFLRLAAGPSFPLGDAAHLGFDLVAPTLWIVKNSAVFSMDVAAEVSFDL